MKRFVCLGVCLSALGLAGEASAQRVSFGVKGGVAVSTVASAGIANFAPDASATATGGAWVGVALGRIVRIQPEVLVSTRKVTSFVSFPTIEVTNRVCDVPMLVVARLAPEAKAHPLLFAGPFVGTVSHVLQRSGGVTADISGVIKDVDAGLVFGGGVEINAGRGGVQLEARVSVGMRNLSETPGVSFKSRGVLALAGYRF